MNAMQLYPRETYVKFLLNHRKNLLMKLGTVMINGKHNVIGYFVLMVLGKIFQGLEILGKVFEI